MKIAFFTEMGFTGKVPRDHLNMRTEFAWMVALDADHYNINDSKDYGYHKYDMGIVIIPKKNPAVDLKNVAHHCKKTAVMQEGPNWLWQDYDLAQQIHYINTLSAADIMFVHNETDKQYYSGLLNKEEVFVLPSLMIEDSINLTIKPEQRSGVMVGGNMVSWYGGFDSYIIAQEFGEEIVAPSMGRKQEGEDQMFRHLPYMNWTEWIFELSKYKYGVHLMRTHAAGTFALNCAYLGIPCIGYVGLDTQYDCHPLTSVKLGDLDAARMVAKHLASDKTFYNECATMATEKYNANWKESVFLSNFLKNK